MSEPEYMHDGSSNDEYDSSLDISLSPAITSHQTHPFPSQNADHWEYISKNQYRCRPCSQEEYTIPVLKRPTHIREHEQSTKHQRNVIKWQERQEQEMAVTDNESDREEGGSTSTQYKAQSAFGRMLVSSFETTHMSQPGGMASVIHHSGFDDSRDYQYELSAMGEAIDRQMSSPVSARSSSSNLLGSETDPDIEARQDLPLSDNSNRENSDENGYSASSEEESIEYNETRTVSVDPEYYPWRNANASLIFMCVLDVSRNIPRAALSRKQNMILKMTIAGLGAKNIPSETTIEKEQQRVQWLCGVQSIRYEGLLGHVYFVNDLAAILAQEMANPLVRRHLRFLPEDSGKVLSEAWQGSRWLNEMDPRFATPMIRHNGQDFYTYEPTLLYDGSVCMPKAWFTRAGNIYARASRMSPSEDRAGWLVHAVEDVEVPANLLFCSYPSLPEMALHYHFPPFRILGTLGDDLKIYSWDSNGLTDEQGHNLWRARATDRQGKSHRVVSMPIWLYCDDTSGNVSKKWNKHNSFLFTLAGLPRQFVHQESNIHFLCTSNIAPPLEMLDGITEQLTACQRQGIWAWDSVEHELVLVIPSVFAMLGDNPMQSEMACHIGLRGRLFCRICKVSSGSTELDDEDEDEDNPVVATDGNISDASAQSTTSQPRTPKGKKPMAKPVTLRETIDRISAFMTVGEPRTRMETISRLHTQFSHATEIGGKAQYMRDKTAYGIKDTFLDTLTEKLFAISATRGTRKSKKEKKADLDNALSTIPQGNRKYSPVWRILELDPHQDTPVEVLHTILLGFVKYFWRDAIKRLNATDQQKLATRLSDLDVSGLNVSPLPGATYVNYAGSLVGREFRIIAQVAPFVLYDLFESEKGLLDVWKALAILIPMSYDPFIMDKFDYANCLADTIDHFLNCVCAVNPRWFNKPKFHLILHLPNHIRRFGPAVLFATEGFESFNAIIRSASVHSNHSAPSRDIARRMARANQIRHLLSGGYFVESAEDEVQVTKEQRRKDKKQIYPSSSPWLKTSNIDEKPWKTAGQGAQGVWKDNTFAKQVLHLDTMNDSLVLESAGLSLKGHTSMKWGGTRACRVYSISKLEELGVTSNDSKVTCLETISLRNGDHCSPLTWIVWNTPGVLPTSTQRHIGQVIEIIQVPRPSTYLQKRADFLLVAPAIIGEPHSFYNMPQITPLNEAVILDPTAPLCTVNIQHACQSHKCPITPSHLIRQEREVTTQLRNGVNHLMPNDLVLNTGKMRDNQVLSAFRCIPPPLNRQAVIEKAAVALTESQKKKQTKQAPLPSVPPAKQTPNSGPGAMAAIGLHIPNPSPLSQVYTPMVQR